MDFLTSISSNLGLDSIGAKISANVTSCFRLHSGACDVVVVRHADGSLHSSSILVHLGKDVPLSKPEDACVRLTINKVETPLVLQVGEDSKCLLEGGGVEPSPAQLAGLSLRSGFNAGIFVVQEFVGEKWEDRKEIPVGFFLWDSSDRVVVMDVEGTVVQGDVWSKSADVLLLSANKQHTASGVGMETVRDGVAPLLSYLDRAGYRVLFLTAVPLTRAGRVRETLNWIRASERATWGRGAEVPASPVLTTRERMGTVLMRKLADKAVATVGGGATQQATFKAEALAQVRALFDDGAARRAPFAGGVVGKGDDARAYVEAGGMPAESVFVLDAKGRVESSCPAHDSLVWASYVEMYGALPKVFPKAPRLSRASGGAGAAPAQ